MVLTHETTHVATRADTTSATPLWLSEGYADWVGYRDSARAAAEAAPELADAVAGGEVPARLPADEDFGFTADAKELARAYEGGWLACRMIAEQWGEDRLDAFYRSVGAHGERAGAVEDAMRKVLGTTQEDFTARWREYLRTRLG
ncbi:Lipoprotein OS=Streptomyces tendae OX=1932 GN=GUR47_11800 PE=4 SV=1 [Streptomyces tendae]